MKKGDSNMWWIIIGAVIAIIVLVLMIVWFTGSGEKLFGSVNKNIGGLEDRDNDNVANVYDKCPCDPRYGEELPEDLADCPLKCSDTG